MARIRTIKPEFWTDEKVLSIKPLTRLLFIGMWNFADDYGRLEFSPISLKARIFPGDSLSPDDVRDMLGELSGADLLTIYSAKGKEYIGITGWHNQKIDKRQVSKIPSQFDDGAEVRDIPPTSADLPRPTPTPAPVMEGNGKESNSEANASGADAPLDPSIPEREYFMRGREVLGKGAGGLIGKLLKAKGGNVALARAAIEQASQKENPTEYIAACCRAGPIAKPLTEFQRKQQETNDVRQMLRDSATATRSGGAADRVLSVDYGERSEGLRGGTGQPVLALSATPGPRGH